MLEKFFLFVLDWLRERLDTGLKKRLDDYKAERARVQKEALETQQALARDAEMLAALKGKRSALQGQIENRTSEISDLKKELKQIDEESTHGDGGDGSDSFHADLAPRRTGTNRND